MQPRPSSFYDHIDIGGGNTKPRSDIPLLCACGDQCSDFQDLRRGQFRPSLLFTSGRSSLNRHVMQIIRLRTLKEIIGITAKRPVALVANEENGPASSSEKESKAMGIEVPFLSACKRPETPVLANRSLGPSPALALRALAGRFIDVAPKAGNVLFGKNGRFSIYGSHSENLRHRFELWLGSSGVRRTVRA